MPPPRFMKTPLRLGVEYKLPSPKVSMFCPVGFGVSAGGADVDIQTTLRLGAGNANKRDQEQRQILIDRFQDTPLLLRSKLIFVRAVSPSVCPYTPLDAGFKFGVARCV